MLIFKYQLIEICPDSPLTPESCHQVVALGFCFGTQTYLQSSWNVLDGLLVFVSLVDILVSLAYTGGNRILGILRVLRLLRTLRPLRCGLVSLFVCSDGTSVNPANLRHDLQGDQPRPWTEAGGGDAHHLSEAHREHRPHLLRVLYRLWHLGSAGASSHKSMFALNKSLRTWRDALLRFKETL